MLLTFVLRRARNPNISSHVVSSSLTYYYFPDRQFLQKMAQALPALKVSTIGFHDRIEAHERAWVPFQVAVPLLREVFRFVLSFSLVS